METKAEWGSCRNRPELYHLFLPPITLTAACGEEVFRAVTTREYPPNPCAECARIYRQARLINKALGIGWREASPQVKKIASYVCNKDAEQAIVLNTFRNAVTEATRRIDTLYMLPPDDSVT